jgi:hypothetical protein
VIAISPKLALGTVQFGMAYGMPNELQFNYTPDVFTMTSREQIAYRRDMLLGPVPGEELEDAFQGAEGPTQ